MRSCWACCWGRACPPWPRLPAEAVYAARGPYPVGTFDTTIPAGDGSPADTGPLAATVWYPALNPDGLPEVASYPWGEFTLQGEALRDAAPDPAGGPYPLVIFSHGLGGLRLQSLFYTEHLASYGFVVIAVDHPGSTLDADGRGADAAGTVPAMMSSYGTRPLDILRTLDGAEALNADGPLAGLIDVTRTAISGHSFGGYTTLATGGARLDFSAFNAWCLAPQAVTFDLPTGTLGSGPAAADLGATACFMRLMGGMVASARGLDRLPDGLWPPTTDPRIKAVVALAPWNVQVFGPEGLAALDVPAMIQVGSADDVTPPERDAYAAYSEVGSAEKALVVFEGGSHLIFADRSQEGWSDVAWQPDEVHPLINHFATAFLRAVLYDDADAAAMLDPASVDFDRVGYAAVLPDNAP